MRWDLGAEGVTILLGLSLGFGLFAHVMLSTAMSRAVGLVATFAFFVGGVLISEVWFGRATATELQPNFDGLSFDEVLLAYLVGIPIVLLARSRTGRPSRSGG
jgi:hypothetical protein